MTEEQLKMKGERGGLCNISRCLAEGAYWYNHSTRKYYCTACANRLNNDPFNAKEAQRILGHELCTLSEDDKKALEEFRKNMFGTP